MASIAMFQTVKLPQSMETCGMFRPRDARLTAIQLRSTRDVLSGWDNPWDISKSIRTFAFRIDEKSFSFFWGGGKFKICGPFIALDDGNIETRNPYS